MSPTVTPPIFCLFALIIGINVYESKDTGFQPSLSSAVQDAFAYRRYLTNKLGVPEDQIRMLINREASRHAILEAFNALKEDHRINEGDPIFIFYAGHGGELTPPQDWESGGSGRSIQMLVPQDYCSEPGSEIPGIPDRQVGALLEGIAEKKSNNITVVLDCCHSASGTREGPSSKFGRVRSVVLNPTIHSGEIWNDAFHTEYSPGRSRFRGSQSHILIAACSSFESARESRLHGQFSASFLKLLWSVQPGELRYSEILTKMDRINGQNPQLEGHNEHRFLFDAEIHAPPPLYYSLWYEMGTNPESDSLGSFFVDAGAAHGITEGTDFVAKQGSDLGISGPLMVEKAMSFSSIIQFKNSPLMSTATTYASASVTPTRAGSHDHLRLCIPQGDYHRSSHEYLLHLLLDNRYNLRNVAIVDDPASAHLEISIRSNKAIIKLVDKRAKPDDFPDFHVRLPTLDAHPEKMVPFLESASKYFWELDRTGEDAGLMVDIELSFYELRECQSPFEESMPPEMKPFGHNLCQRSKVENVEEDRFYGIKLTNHSSRDLFPSLFYFDTRDPTCINSYYSPPSSGPYLPEAPLKKEGGTLTIGYGSGGIGPLSYSLRENQEFAVGFLKLFVFTRPLNFSSRLKPNSESETWGTLLIPITQRRYPIRTDSSSRPRDQFSSH